MATKRLSMRNVREILRMKWLLRRSHREIAKSLEISAGSVGSVVARAKAKGLSWAAVPLPCRRTDAFRLSSADGLVPLKS
jgi:transposase